jgi:hypothetical protein
MYVQSLLALYVACRAFRVELPQGVLTNDDHRMTGFSAASSLLEQV